MSGKEVAWPPYERREYNNTPWGTDKAGLRQAAGTMQLNDSQDCEEIGTREIQQVLCSTRPTQSDAVEARTSPGPTAACLVVNFLEKGSGTFR